MYLTAWILWITILQFHIWISHQHTPILNLWDDGKPVGLSFCILLLNTTSYSLYGDGLRSKGYREGANFSSFPSPHDRLMALTGCYMARWGRKKLSHSSLNLSLQCMFADFKIASGEATDNKLNYIIWEWEEVHAGIYTLRNSCEITNSIYITMWGGRSSITNIVHRLSLPPPPRKTHRLSLPPPPKDSLVKATLIAN